jgi:hypothetical protein
MRPVRLVAFALALAATTPAFAAGVAPAHATPVQREQAQSRFLRGKERFAKHKFEEALVEFSASLDIVASPNARLYVGRCLRELGRIVPAYVELGRTEVEAKELSRDDPRYEKAGQSAHEERAKLEPQLAFINIEIGHAEAATTVKVAGDEIRRGGWSEPIPVMPGKAEVVVETPGRPPVGRTVDLAATDRKVVTIDLADADPPVAAAVEKPPPPAEPVSTGSGMRDLAYVAGGVAIVGAGLFAFFGLKANSTYSDLDKACNSGPCPPGHDSDISTGRTQQAVANVGLAVFLVGAATATTLWVLSPSSSSKSTASHRPRLRTGQDARARIDVGPSFVGLHGAF